MDSYLFAVAGIGLFLAGILKGATGLGYSSCALPFLVAAVGLKPAMALVLIPAMATNVAVAVTAGHFKEIVHRFHWFYVAMLPGIAVGIALLLHIEQAKAVHMLGLVIVSYALFTLLHPRLALPVGAEKLLKVPIGFTNGVLTGLSGSQVMPLFPYMMALNLDSDRLVQAINITVMLASLLLAAGLLATGIMTPLLFSASLLAVVPALFGVQIGTRARRRLPATHFRSIALIVLLGIGGSMVLR